MNWINVALIVCVIAGVCLIAYLMWFMAHPRTREQAQDEADEWARKHRMPPSVRTPEAGGDEPSEADQLKLEEQRSRRSV